MVTAPIVVPQYVAVIGQFLQEIYRSHIRVIRLKYTECTKILNCDLLTLKSTFTLNNEFVCT